MIEVKLIVQDAIELGMLAQLQQMIELKRKQDNMAVPQPLMHAPHMEVVREEASFHQASTLDGTEHIVNTAAAAPEEPASAPVPSDIEVARAITTYSQKEGVPKARELIESFGVKNAMSIPDERRAEFVAKTQQ